MKVINKVVECVASFDSKGKIRPERIRLTDDEGEYQVIIIDKIMKNEHVKYEGQLYVMFVCTGIINGVEKIFELRYIKMDVKWILWKI